MVITRCSWHLRSSKFAYGVSRRARFDFNSPEAPNQKKALVFGTFLIFFPKQCLHYGVLAHLKPSSQDLEKLAPGGAVAARSRQLLPPVYLGFACFCLHFVHLLAFACLSLHLALALAALALSSGHGPRVLGFQGGSSGVDFHVFWGCQKSAKK